MRTILLIGLLFPQLLLAQGFRYPVPPDSIADRHERVNYMVERFWDAENVADTTVFQHPTVLMDYIYLLQQTDTSHVRQGINRFIKLACRQEATFGVILYWLDTILYDSSSPHYNEPLYALFMDAVITSEADTVMKLIPHQRLDIMSRNKVGERAINFTFRDSHGLTTDLYHVEAPHLLLIFNNPDCSVCQQTEKLIEEHPVLRLLQVDNRLKVVAIAPDADIDEWQQRHYPAHWITGIDADKTIVNERLYDIQHFPSIYLLDYDKRVLLKEADFDRLMKFLQRATRTLL
ncbi:DUF5106 domain-containing protein [Prevotella sp. E2-28]|jgi:hypothetical protein|uniref:DUF5106 domain-containing protein n=1 Tax=Prevotella sp. E2-28 TaxID=2913620 RepID=UPI001EDA9D5B|nr:DUF5106 domain-containing protein [Prevotella sp. E2-28]UKK53383.1 DUF5106 domain-containing protein [Prevotella sp. E2-28]